MDEHATAQVQFDNLFQKPLHVTFQQPETSSNGGAILLHALAHRLGIIQAFTSHIEDKRDPAKVQHSMAEVIAQRLYALQCGYEDCNDAATLAHDPVVRLIGKSDRQTEESLASQPTLSRVENRARLPELFATGTSLAECVLDHQKQRRKKRRKPKNITLDLDPTDDPTYGQQAFSFYNGYYDNHCYLPVLAFVSFDREPEQYLVASVLRPGNTPAARNAPSLIARLVHAVRKRWPKAKILVRLDAAFANPQIYDLLESLNVGYLVAIPANERLKEYAQHLMQDAEQYFRQQGNTWQFFGAFQYAADSWSRKRRVVAKAEVVQYPGREPRHNLRFLVTNLLYRPDRLYFRYAGRGDAENRIKELFHASALDRTSCHRFEANVFRNLLSAAAYMLFQALRDHLAHTRLRRAQAPSMRARLLKVAAKVRVSCRRIHLDLPRAFPDADLFLHLARLLGAGIQWHK